MTQWINSGKQEYAVEASWSNKQDKQLIHRDNEYEEIFSARFDSAAENNNDAIRGHDCPIYHDCLQE